METDLDAFLNEILETAAKEDSKERDLRLRRQRVKEERDYYRSCSPEIKVDIWAKKYFEGLEDNLFKDEDRRRETGFFHYPPILLKDGLDILGNDTQGKKYLEFGSGMGFNVILADLLGYDAYGIEINKELHNTAFEVLKETKIVLERDISPTFIHGNYLTKEYSLDFERGVAQARKYMGSRMQRREEKVIKKIIEEHNLDMKKIPFKGRDYFFLNSNGEPDTYEQNNIKLQDFDVCFGYFWGPESPAAIEQFARFAKDDASFFLCFYKMPLDYFKDLEEWNLQQEVIPFNQDISYYGRYTDWAKGEQHMLRMITKK